MRRSERHRIAPLVFTPTPKENCPRPTTNLNSNTALVTSTTSRAQNRTTTSKSVPYTKNLRKATQQKIEAANREHPICIEHKHGNIVIDFSAAAYEYFKHTLLETLHTSQYEIIVADKRDSKQYVMEESLSVLNESKLQLFRVNCYNTSSRVLINGKNQHLFLTSILPCILNNLSDKSGLLELNRNIKKLSNII